jgi:hypothetical protein
MNRRAGCVENESSLHQLKMPQPPTGTPAGRVVFCPGRKEGWDWTESALTVRRPGCTFRSLGLCPVARRLRLESACKLKENRRSLRYAPRIFVFWLCVAGNPGTLRS